ncbi:GntR family transcriptional regulator [Aeromicrobium sp. CTD01-1L150]|uniref:GntR family transcriptional regulator n=1 Tax=Aeromicrobium sp. CTD01-1L150 TaxID=3341830 RepID=UPI0035BEC3B1
MARNNGSLYRTIQGDIQRDILSGTLTPGDWLPSESQLQHKYEVSQTSVRRALLELQRLGLIERFHGRGSVVASNRVRAMSPMLGLGRELRQAGFVLRPELLTNQRIDADETVADALGLMPGDPVRHIERRYLCDDRPLVFLEHYLPALAGVDFDEFTGDSLYAFLTVRDAQPFSAHEKVRAVNLVDSTASRLDVPPGTAALLRERVSIGGDRQPMEYTRYLLNGDLYHLEIDLKNELIG